MPIGILSAMPEEDHLLVKSLTGPTSFSRGGRNYSKGDLFGKEVVIAFSQWGKVAAALTATQLMAEFDIEALVFTGVAGAVSSHLKVGDIVVADQLIQHDLDARPFFSRYEVPLAGSSLLVTDKGLSDRAFQAAERFLKGDNPRSSTVHRGLIGSADKFFSCKKEIETLRAQLPTLLATEMEGAAIAQVCLAYQIPYTVIRTISDSADEHSPEDFKQFILSDAARYSYGILREMFK